MRAGSQKNREPRLAVRAVKGTVFSTALRTTGTTARTRQDKHNIRKADTYNGLAMVRTKQIPNNSIRRGRVKMPSGAFESEF